MEYIQAGVDSLRNHIRESLDVSEKRNIFASMVAGLLVSSSRRHCLSPTCPLKKSYHNPVYGRLLTTRFARPPVPNTTVFLRLVANY